MPDSREILFASRGALWRLDALGGGAPMRLAFVGQDGVTPVVARTAEGRPAPRVRAQSDRQQRLAHRRRCGPGAPASSPPSIAIASTRTDAIANVSPDARQLAFLSNRSGDPQIWVARQDGAEAFQLTSLAFGRLRDSRAGLPTASTLPSMAIPMVVRTHTSYARRRWRRLC